MLYTGTPDKFHEIRLLFSFCWDAAACFDSFVRYVSVQALGIVIQCKGNVSSIEVYRLRWKKLSAHSKVLKHGIRLFDTDDLKIYIIYKSWFEENVYVGNEVYRYLYALWEQCLSELNVLWIKRIPIKSLATSLIQYNLSQ